MSTVGQIHWHEGLFLQPHHLQGMQRFMLDMVADAKADLPALPDAQRGALELVADGVVDRYS